MHTFTETFNKTMQKVPSLMHLITFKSNVCSMASLLFVCLESSCLDYSLVITVKACQCQLAGGEGQGKVSVCSREISFPLIGEYLYLTVKSLLNTHTHTV